MDASLPAPVWVSTIADFQAMLDELMRSSIVAVDTESNSLFAYHERVCLVQISTQKTDYLVDPLVVDINALGRTVQFAEDRKSLPRSGI